MVRKKDTIIELKLKIVKTLKKYGIKVYPSHLNSVSNGNRLLTSGISCSWILENMPISSQATDDTSVEGSETTGFNKRVE